MKVKVLVWMFRVWGLGFGVYRVWGLGRLGFRVCGLVGFEGCTSGVFEGFSGLGFLAGPVWGTCPPQALKTETEKEYPMLLSELRVRAQKGV